MKEVAHKPKQLLYSFSGQNSVVSSLWTTEPESRDFKFKGADIILYSKVSSTKDNT